jgi:hypothetical protein
MREVVLALDALPSVAAEVSFWTRLGVVWGSDPRTCP